MTATISDNSLISAEASGGANGGNIEIATDFLLGSGNSDIIANAFEGRGGFIEIAAEGIFGLESRTQLTELNDITAFSQQNPELDGTIEIITPDVNQNLGLLQLPMNPVSAQVVQACELGGSQSRSEFVVTGRSGLPDSPSGNLNGNNVLEDWRVEEEQNGAVSADENGSQPDLNSTEQIVEASSWEVNNRGKVVLVANNSANVPSELSQQAINCSTNK